MSKAKLVSFIADIKLTEDNEVKILELGSVFWSGFSGYERLTGENPVEKYIFPFYKSFGIPVYSGNWLNGEYENETIKLDGIFSSTLCTLHEPETFSPNQISDHSAIIMRSGYSSELDRHLVANDHKGRFIVTDQNSLANACFENKVLFAALSENEIPSLLPKKNIYALEKNHRIDVLDLLQDFKDHDEIVIKAPVMARGEGVHIVDMDDVKNAYAKYGRLVPIKKIVGKRWRRSNIACVVEELVPGKPVIAEDKTGENQSYDPAIRVLMSAWVDNGKTHIECHDAYAKLPEKGVSDKRSYENTVSSIHAKHGPRSAAVSDEDKELIFDQLHKGLRPLFEKIFNKNSSELARELLSSAHEGKKRAGVMIASDTHYFDRNKEEGGRYPSDISDVVWKMKESSAQIAKYIKSLKSNVSWRGLIKKGSPQTEAFLPKLIKDDAQKKSKKSTSKGSKPLIATFMSLAFAPAILSIVVNSGKPDPEEVFDNHAFMTYIDGVDNLKYKSFSHVSNAKQKIDSLKEAANGAGYDLCISGRWLDEAQRLFPAFKLAVDNPEISFVKVDIGSTESHPNNILSTEDEYVMDTMIFGTACPKLGPES